MYSIYQIGTAGSGKTLLTEKLISLYNDKGNSVASINLDPGVRSLPYTPDFDIREYIDIDSFTFSKGLFSKVSKSKSIIRCV